MPTNDYKAYAIAGGANVVDQATYAASAYVTTGRAAGILPSNVFNKIARQGSIGAAAIGQLINNALGLDALDDGNFATLVANFTTAILATVYPTGRVRATISTSAATGFVMLNDGSIGSATSGGTTRANADCQNLFTLIWNNFSNSTAPVSGGRGGSAAADWAANKNIQVGTFLGRALASAGAGAGLSARALGSIFGEETHLQTIGELPSHRHSSVDGVILSTVGGGQQLPTGGLNSQQTIGLAGGGAAFNVMQPSSFINLECKL